MILYLRLVISHETYMRRALDLAIRGLGKVQPNPMVGSVIVFEDEIIGEGYHHVYGGPHAEVVAIQSVKNTSLLASSTLYVTLEPCSHYGKTPPCSELIIDKNIKKVVIGSIDPFEEVNGKGIERLKKAGIEVISGILKEECDWINRRFMTFHKRKRPYIILKWAQSKDGFIDPSREKNQKGSIAVSSEFSRILSHKWRTEEQAIAVGKNTALTDNPMLTPRLYKGKDPLRIVIDPDLQVGPEYHLLSDENKTLIINKTKTGTIGKIIYCKADFRNFMNSFDSILHELNIQSVLIEGGRFTLQEFIDSNHWDEARVFTSGMVFKKGVPSPDFRQTPSEELLSGPDNLRIYYNKQA